MLDEYVGLPHEHPQRYRNVIKLSSSTRLISIRLRYLGRMGWPRISRALVRRTNEPLRTPVVSTYRFLGSAPTGTSARSTNQVPRSRLRTRIKTLTSQTRRDNARFFGGNVEDVRSTA